MRTYFASYKVKAEPMTKFEALLRYNMPWLDDESDAAGYLIISGNEVYWMDKSEFESYYSIADTSPASLNGKLMSLQWDIALLEGQMHSEDVSQSELILLKEQLEAMRVYRASLLKRQDLTNGNNNFSHNTMGVGAMIMYLKAGSVVRRVSWNKYVTMFMQVPARIESSKIKGMTSLPPQAKEYISEHATTISYSDQCLLYNCISGAATYWQPSVDDLLATDWVVVK